MKIIYSLIILLIINFSVGIEITCNEDYNCPNLPYQYCENKWKIDARSIGIDNEKIYFTARPNVNNDNGNVGPSYLVGVNKNGDTNFPGTQVITKISDEIPNGAVFNRVNGIAGINKIGNTGKFMIIQDMYKYLPLYGTYDSGANKFTTAFKQNPENQIYIDGDIMYRCIDDRLEQVSPIPLTLESIFTSNTVFKTSYCLALTKNGNTLYFTQRTQIGGNWFIGFYSGSKECRNCLLPVPLFTVPDTIVYSIAAYGEYIYYSTGNGLFRVPILPIVDVSKRIKLSDNPNIKGIVLDSNTNSIVYASSSAIVKIGLPDQRITSLYDSTATTTPFSGNCRCVSSFNGDNCQTCNGTISWKFDGSKSVPVCSPFKEDGSVSYCSADWECLSLPWGYCSSNQCQCRRGFAGNRCQYCSSNNITWSDGIPTCNLYYHGYTTDNHN